MRCKGLLLTAITLACLAVISCNSDDQSTNSGDRPQITSVTPSQLNPGTENTVGSIFGQNLNGVISIDLEDGIIIEKYRGISATEIYFAVTVTRDARPGPRTVSVRTNAGVATSSNVFTVGDNVLPLANFSVTPPLGLKATNFRFDGSRSADPDGNIIDYRWSFGDGKSASGRIVNHQYDAARDFDVRLTVTDNHNASDTSSRFLVVEASKSPIASFSFSPSTGTVATTFTFNASASRDPDGEVKQYLWNFGDGTGGSGKVVEHRYSLAGFFPVKLTVTDNTRMSTVVTESVQVGDVPGDDDDDDDDSGGECTNPARRGPILYGTLISADPSSNTAIVQFDPSLTCRDGFYNCGDFRKSDPEKFYGIVRRMFDLGGGKFQVQVDCPVIFPDGGSTGEGVFIIYKTCSENFCPD